MSEEGGREERGEGGMEADVFGVWCGGSFLIYVHVYMACVYSGCVYVCGGGKYSFQVPCTVST